jgi:hypothetical protein
MLQSSHLMCGGRHASEPEPEPHKPSGNLIESSNDCHHAGGCCSLLSALPPCVALQGAARMSSAALDSVGTKNRRPGIDFIWLGPEEAEPGPGSP